MVLKETLAQSQEPVGWLFYDFKKCLKMKYKKSLGIPQTLNTWNANLTFINNKCLIYNC